MTTALGIGLLFNTSLLVVFSRATLELKDQDDVVGQNHRVDSLPPAGDWVFQKQVPAPCGLWTERRS